MMISSGMLAEIAHSADATVNAPTDAKKTGLVPKRSPIQPDAATQIAMLIM
jgi:hypothetical protein